MNKTQALLFLGYMIGRLGGGYHPDNSLSEYVDRSDKSTFTADEIARLQPMHDEMNSILGEKVYEYAMTLTNKAVGL